LADRRETLLHDQYLGALYNASPTIQRATPQEKFRAKNIQNLASFIRIQILIANITGISQDIRNWKDVIDSNSPAEGEKSGELWSTD